MSGRVFLKVLKVHLLLSLVAICGASSQNANPSSSTRKESNTARLMQLVEANIIATHAYQVLLAKKSGKGDPACYGPGKLSDRELETLVDHQARLLKSDVAAVNAWVRRENTTFNPAQDLEPILSAGLAVPSGAPVNIFNDYLRQNAKADPIKTRTIASLYQTVLEIEGVAEWQIAGRKIWNWGEKNLHIRDEKVLASELLREPDMKALQSRLRALPAQKIAVIGHSFTMGLHWSSPSSFVPIVIDVLRRENPKVEFRQFVGGGLTATRAQQRFYQSVLDWKPNKVMLVVMTRTDEDYEALKQLGTGFAANGIKTFMFDEVHDPASVKPGTVERAISSAHAGGIEVIEIGSVLASAPDRDKFICLDGIHMTEPYHRLMAKEWLKFLAGARGAKVETARK